MHVPVQIKNKPPQLPAKDSTGNNMHDEQEENYKLFDISRPKDRTYNLSGANCNSEKNGIGKTQQLSHNFSDIAIHSGQFIQPKLSVNTPGDEHEQEADAMADKVMHMPEPAPAVVTTQPVTIVQNKSNASGKEEPEEEKKEHEEEKESLASRSIQRKLIASDEEEKNRLHRKESGDTFPVVSPNVHQVIQSPGQPLDQSIRSFMESRFGFDFSKVQIHNNSLAHQSAKDINALAYTHQHHIVFGVGQYQPQTGAGKKLLAHELMHVLQQGNKNMIQRMAEGNFDLGEDVSVLPEADKVVEDMTLEEANDMSIEEAKFIVEDGTEPDKGQMRKSDFLEALNDAICRTVDSGLRGTEYSSDNCPYIRAAFARHRNSSAARLEQVIARYEPRTTFAQSAEELIELMLQRVSVAVNQWKRRGSLADVTEDIAGLLSKGGSDSPPANTEGGDTSSETSLQFKANAGGAQVPQSPQAVMQSLGKGSALDGGTRSRMEGAFETDFGNVEIHTDSHAANLAGGMNARAFAVGNHIAFGSGEHQPGTLVGDALIAHELAHVEQQQNTNKDQNILSDDLERDADNTSIHIIGQLLGAPKSAMGKIARITQSRLKSGLRLQACGSKKTSSKVVVKNPFEEPTAVQDAVGAAGALDTYKGLAEAERIAVVTTANRKTLISVLRTISPTDQAGKYRDQIREITRWIEESETRSSAKMTDDQIAAEQAKFRTQEDEAAAKAAKAATAPKGTPVAPPTPAEIAAESKKKVESTSIAPPSPINAWDALASIPGEQAKWTKRGNDAIANVVSHIQKNHPELGITAANFNLDFHAVAARGATVIAAGSPAQVGFTFVSTAELNPAYVVDIVVHEVYGHPEYGVYGTEYQLALYDKAAPKVPGYTKPTGSARTTELDSIAYQETEIYAVLRSMPYRTAPTVADAPKVPDTDTQVLVDWHVDSMKKNWAPSLIVPIVRGLRARLQADPRITPSALAVFDKAIDNNFPVATAGLIKK